MKGISLPPANVCRKIVSDGNVQTTFRLLCDFYKVPMPVILLPQKGNIWTSFCDPKTGQQTINGLHAAGAIWLTNQPTNHTIFHEFFHYLIWKIPINPFGKYDTNRPHDERLEEVMADAYADKMIKMAVHEFWTPT